MNIDRREIEERKRLFGIEREDIEHLVACRDAVVADVRIITNTFFAIQGNNPEVAAVLKDPATMSRLGTALQRYIAELFQGRYDEAYVESRLRVGEVHEQLGVTPKLYISAVRLLQALIDKTIDTKCCAEEGEVRQRRKEALHKILLFDTQFVFDTYIDCLMRAVKSARRELETYAQGLELKVAERTRQLFELARTDSLTQIFNRRGFEEHLHREMAVAKRHNQALSLIYFDLNGLKNLNDTEGHDAGDAVLVSVGRTLLETVRQGDIPCRFGGDEFCIITPRTALEGARLVAERLITTFRECSRSNVSFSIGIAQTGPRAFVEPDDLVRMADTLMYDAKTEARRNPGHYIRTAPA